MLQTDIGKGGECGLGQRLLTPYSELAADLFRQQGARLFSQLIPKPIYSQQIEVLIGLH
jgi:hypothetical protein